MIKKIIRLYNDFMDFLLIRKLTWTIELTEKDKVILRGYDKEFEKKLNKVLLNRLAQEMIDEGTTPEHNRWAQLALSWRIAILWNLTKKD